MPTCRPVRPGVLALALCAFPAAAAEEPKAPDLPIEGYRLPNGLKVVLSRDPSVPRITVCVAYHVGSKNERAGRTGTLLVFAVDASSYFSRPGPRIVDGLEILAWAVHPEAFTEPAADRIARVVA